MPQLKIREMPQDERPREKLLARGADALSNAELIAILLRTGRRGMKPAENAVGIWKTRSTPSDIVVVIRSIAFCEKKVRPFNSPPLASME